MAITGLLLIGFVFVHALGNLKVYLGAEDFNHYGEFLRELLVPFLPRTVFLWIMRIGLILAFAFHIHSAYSLTRMNRRASGTGYVQEPRLAGRQLRQPHDALDRHHRRPCSSSSTWPTSPGARPTPTSCGATCTGTSWPPSAARRWPIIYLVANVALGIHLFHGAWSMFQSLGAQQPAVELVATRLRHRPRGAHHRHERDVPDLGADRHRGAPTTTPTASRRAT